MTYLERSMKNRTPIAAADLYVMLQREFRRRQISDCSTCYVQWPFRVDRSDGNTANWEVIVPSSCTNNCREVLNEVVDDFSRRYDLLAEATS